MIGFTESAPCLRPLAPSQTLEWTSTNWPRYAYQLIFAPCERLISVCQLQH